MANPRWKIQRRSPTILRIQHFTPIIKKKLAQSFQNNHNMNQQESESIASAVVVSIGDILRTHSTDDDMNVIFFYFSNNL